MLNGEREKWAFDALISFSGAGGDNEGDDVMLASLPFCVTLGCRPLAQKDKGNREEKKKQGRKEGKMERTGRQTSQKFDSV